METEHAQKPWETVGQLFLTTDNIKEEGRAGWLEPGKGEFQLESEVILQWFVARPSFHNATQPSGQFRRSPHIH